MSRSEIYFDDLVVFSDWYMRQPFSIPACPADGVVSIGGIAGLTLYRHGRYQVQLFICPPNSEIPDHSHPSVDTIIVHLSGEIDFRKNGEKTLGGATAHGDFIRILSIDSHGGTIGKAGAAFMNFQSWLNGEPTSAEKDWEGDPICDAHKKLLEELAE